MSPLRILYAPRNIAGQAELYARAVRALGHEAHVWSYGPPAFGFGADRIIDEKRFRVDPAYRWDLFDDAVRNYDVFHFQYGRSLVLPDIPELSPLADLPMLSSLEKKLIMNFRGSDVRLRSVHLEREPDSYMRDPAVQCDEPRLRANISICRRYCETMLVSTPGLLDYVPDALWLPHVVDIAWWQGVPREPAATIPTVLHLPSRRSTKSSDVVGRICRQLDGEGVIRYQERSGLDRAAVRREFSRADLVIDSLAIGDHGLVSVEAMAAGAIPIAHIHPTNRARNAGVPVVEASVHDLGAVLRRLASNPLERRSLREAGYEWVRRNHSLEQAGELLVDVYRRPRTRSGLSDPAFPIVGDDQRCRSLEGEIERLRVLVGTGDGRLRRRRAERRFADHIKVRTVPRVKSLAHRSGLVRVVRGFRRRCRAWVSR